MIPVLALLAFAALAQTAPTPADDDAMRGGQLLAAGEIDEARKVLVAACEAGSAIACSNMSGLEMSTNHPAEAIGYARKSCDMGWMMGCADLGYMLVRGIGATADPIQGYGYTATACRKGWATSCGEQAQMLVSGVGTAADPVAALPLMTKACEGSNNPSFCLQLGGMYEQGVGVSKDLAQAESAYGQACQKGLREACGRLPYVVRDSGDAERAYKISVELCQQREDYNCGYQGTALIKGWGVKVNLEHAKLVCETSCDRGSFEGCGCLALAEDAIKPGSRAANKAMARACAIAPERCAP